MTVAGNSSRKGAVRGAKKTRSVGSGGKGRARLAGKGPTPKAADRPYHAAAKSGAKKSAGSGKAASGTGAAKRGSSDRPRSAASSSSGKAAGRGAGGKAAGRGPAVKGAGRGPATKGASRSAAARGGSRTPATRGPARSTSGGRKVTTTEVISGRNAVLEALQAGVPTDVVYVMAGIDSDDRIREIIGQCRSKRLQLLEVSRTDLDRMTSEMAHQGVAARIPAYKYRETSDLLHGGATLIVALDSVTDPRNLGAVIRSAAAFGATGIVIPQRRAAGVTAAAWKTSAGAAARIPVAQATNLVRALKECQEAGCFVIGLAGDGAQSLADAAHEFFDGPAVIVVGSEGEGLSRLVRQTCDVVVRIDIDSATESLNASVATSIALYEAARARKAAGL
ncbi:MAG: 23S rRNA (guanosine(2251)-2'-O)-methyltransferase RlmB [Actinomycetales bacterium]|nr:23S rRNA (guanosine(2251)-2'-O)-methyltransferase RlmB [Actinomycetales bacterium]